jgi:hypothetical protein
VAERFKNAHNRSTERSHVEKDGEQFVSFLRLTRAAHDLKEDSMAKTKVKMKFEGEIEIEVEGDIEPVVRKLALWAEHHTDDWQDEGAVIAGIGPSFEPEAAEAIGWKVSREIAESYNDRIEGRPGRGICPRCKHAGSETGVFHYCGETGCECPTPAGLSIGG